MTVRTTKTKTKRLNWRLRKLVADAKKKLIPKEFDSAFEFKLNELLGKDWEHHPARIKYTSTHTYQPDFRRVVGDKVVLIEAKGRFRTRNESSKYLAIRECLAANEELVFIFQDADVPMVGAQKRKDGTKQTHGEWAEINNFRYYCYKKGLPNEFQ